MTYTPSYGTWNGNITAAQSADIDNTSVTQLMDQYESVVNTNDSDSLYQNSFKYQ